jgi:putative heme iron utilization protein
LSRVLQIARNVRYPFPTEKEVTMPDAAALGRDARHLMRGTATAVLGTLTSGIGAPYASLVLTASLPDATPVMLLSTLAEHTKNLGADPRVSLLYDGTLGLQSRLTGPRLTLQGRVERCRDRAEAALARRRFLARHDDAAMYVDFRDFAFYCVRPTAAHLVAGFGRIDWIAADQLRFAMAEHEAVTAAEVDICDHMNGEHRDAIDTLAARAGRSGPGWQMTGCDPEGCDLKRTTEHARMAFPAPARDADAVRRTIIELIRGAT